MTSNQMHGKKFEDIIKSVFTGASDTKRSNTSKWDIEAKFDRDRFLSTSIKTSGEIVVGMADARNFMLINEPFRLLVCLYEQSGDLKICKEIREYIITLEVLAFIQGDLKHGDVELFHNDIAKIPAGKKGQEAGKLIVDTHKQKIKDIKTMVKLNPKIDSKNQRRLQCSINLTEVEKIPNLEFIIHDETFKDLVLPIKIRSQRRKFKKDQLLNK